jgi:hypothetical protein
VDHHYSKSFSLLGNDCYKSVKKALFNIPYAGTAPEGVVA